MSCMMVAKKDEALNKINSCTQQIKENLSHCSLSLQYAHNPSGLPLIFLIKIQGYFQVFDRFYKIFQGFSP